MEPLSHLNYCKIASHYEWALKQVFDRAHAGGVRFDRVIILEDDMELAPDFFSYFRATSPLLDTDPTMFCVSAWNDNGQAQFVHEPTRALPILSSVAHTVACFLWIDFFHALCTHSSDLLANQDCTVPIAFPASDG
jgi:hypothetical protein